MPLQWFNDAQLKKEIQNNNPNIIVGTGGRLSDAISNLYTSYFSTQLHDQLTNSRRGEDHVACEMIGISLQQCHPERSEAKPKDLDTTEDSSLVAQNDNIREDINQLLTIPHSISRITHLIIDQSKTHHSFNGTPPFGMGDKGGIKTITIPDGRNKNHYLQTAYSLTTQKKPLSTDKTNNKHSNTQILNNEKLSTVNCRLWTDKPSLLLHICCAPDLTRPLHRLKNYFKLYLFRYNPNIHPRAEHTKRYDQFIKLTGLETWDYEILEDRYDPKEFFDAFHEKRNLIQDTLSDATYTQVLQTSASMPERSARCNPCYAMRLQMAAKNASDHQIPYFTSTLLISPKKDTQKLFEYGVLAEQKYPTTKFLRFDFAKNNGHHQAGKLTQKHGLRRQKYCWCSRTIPQFQKEKVAKAKNNHIQL